jgi:hypothetical protein
VYRQGMRFHVASVIPIAIAQQRLSSKRLNIYSTAQLFTLKTQALMAEKNINAYYFHAGEPTKVTRRTFLHKNICMDL